MRVGLTTGEWSRLEMVDEDLTGLPGPVVLLAGFDQMVAEVCFGKVAQFSPNGVFRFPSHSRGYQQRIEVRRSRGDAPP